MKAKQSPSIPKARLASSRGFSLVEALLGVSIFGLIMTGLVGAFLYGQESNIIAGNRTRASFLADEALEVVANIGQQNFGLIGEGTTGIATTSSQWIFSGTSQQIGIFTRQLEISVPNNLTRIVSSTVTWQQNNQRTGVITLVRKFTNWLIKTLTETTEAEFSGGRINGVQTQNDAGGEVQNKKVGDWSGILLTDEYDLDSTGNANDLDIHFASQQMITVADNTTGDEFNVFDISDISNTGLSYLGGLDYSFNLNEVSIYDGYAYVASDDANELLVIRLADISQVNTYDLPSDSNAESIKVVNGIAYIGTANSASEEFYALDVSDPEGTITEIDAVEIGGTVYAIDISGGYAYLATDVNTDELTVVRLSDYSNVNTYSTGGNDMYDVFVYNNVAYLAGAQSGSPEIYAIDISSPESSLSSSGTADTGGDANGIAVDYAGNIFVSTSDDSKEVYVFDSGFSELSSYDVPGSDNYNGIGQFAGYIYAVGGADARELVVVESSSGWQYRKSHTINGSSAGAQSNFPIQIFVYYGSGTDSGDTVYCNSNCQSDFGDIRFTNSNGDMLDYFMDEVYTSNYARFWVEIDSIPASPSSVDIYMLYGNILADTTSSGENTFEAFVDYTIDGTESYGGQDFDPAQYEIQTPNPPNNEDSQLHLWGNNWKYSLNSITVNSNGSQYLEWWFNSSGEEGEVHAVGFDNDNGLSTNYLYRTYGTQNLGEVADTQYNDVTGGWQLITTVLNDFSGTFDRITTINDADGNENTDNLTKNVRVRTRVSPEPTHGSWGSQESGSFGAETTSVFSYQKTHTINGTSAGAQTNYPIQLFVYYGSGTDSGDTVYCDSKCQTDFDDIRFTNSSGGNLDYFVDEAVASSFARIWVEVDSIPASPGSVDIIMLYGNSGVDSESDGSATFEAFLDYTVGGVSSFSNQDSDSAQYEVQTPNPPNNQDTQLRQWGNTWKASFENMTINGNGSQYLEWWFNSTGAQEGEIYGIGIENDDGLTSNLIYQIYGTQSYGRVADTQYNDGAGGWQLITHSLDEFSGSYDRFVTICDADAGQSTEAYTRNVRVRTRVTPEPTHGAWGTEQSIGVPKFLGAFTSEPIDSGSVGTTWTDVLWQATSTDATKYLRFQLRTAPDDGGSPGTWSEWFGPEGRESFFTDASGDGLANAVHRDGVDDQWVQYRAFLYGTIVSSPILESVDLRYND